MQLYYKQPKYYKDFYCIGGECPINCCHGWQIDWKKDEYDRLISAELPDELRDITNHAFFYNIKNGRYNLDFAEDGNCIFLDRGD